jgi:hypothetical protein
MAKTSAPSSVTIRMYNVGFGDCFLLTFAYGKRERHMLVDYGSTSAPKNGKKTYMEDIAKDVAARCNGKLDIVVATHRHRDHISGFSTTAGTGKIIAGLNPDHVIQPWTEDPKAKPDALTATSSIYTKGKADPRKMTAHFLGSLDDMQGVAAAVARFSNNENVAGPKIREQLKFLGEDNLKNLSAVENLMAMGKKGKAWYVNAGMKLNSLLPGVKITVLGPPNLEQSDKVRKQRSKDPNEFWQFRSFWASQRFAMTSSMSPGGGHLFPKAGGKRSTAAQPNVRWFVRQSRQIPAYQMLELVRDLDSVMNNTSIILLLEIGKRKLLFPGDAQIENWAYALSNAQWKKLLADVGLYKVGHHGSLNATPKSLWKLFDRKGGEHKHDRLETLCSTKPGKHGTVKSGTEVPRRVLVEELEKDSSFTSTECYRKTIYQDFTIDV